MKADFIQFRADRSRLRIKVRMWESTIGSADQKCRWVFELHITNTGRRVCYVDSVRMHLQQQIPLLADRLVPVYRTLHAPEKEEPIKLEENQKRVFRVDPVSDDDVKRLGFMSRVTCLESLSLIPQVCNSTSITSRRRSEECGSGGEKVAWCEN